MAPSLRQLLAEPGLGVALVTGEERLDETVRWVATNEHSDPTPFLQGGELLLTTGIKLPRTAERMQEYTDRVAAAGAIALGLGLGLGHETVPPRLVHAAERSGLALLEIDEPTPFVAVSKALSDLIAREQQAEAVRITQAQRELARAAVRDGAAGVTRTAARLVRGWAVVLDRTRSAEHAEPAEAAHRVTALEQALSRVTTGQVAAQTLVDGEEHISVQTLTVSGRVRGYLVCGTRHRPGGAERAILGLATALLSIARDRQVAGYRTRHTAMLRLLRQGTVTDPDLLADLGSTVLRRPLQVLAATGPAPEVRALAEEIDDLPAAQALGAITEDRLLAVLDPGQVEGVLRRARERPQLRCGVSEVLPPTQTAVAIHQAERTLAVSLRRDEHTVTHAETMAGPASLVDPDDADAYARRLLAPLVEHGERTDVDLVGTLEVWLRHHGLYEPAAAELGIHRHTLRHRVRRVEQLLARPVDDPDTRMDIWFALRVLHSG